MPETGFWLYASASPKNKVLLISIILPVILITSAVVFAKRHNGKKPKKPPATQQAAIQEIILGDKLCSLYAKRGNCTGRCKHSHSIG